MTTKPNPRQYPPTRLAFHASRIVIDVGVLLVLGAMSLPFVSAEGYGQRALAADALPALLLVLPIFVITLLPDQARPIPTGLGWLSLLLAATALPYAVVKYLDASTLARTLNGSVGIGARILVLGAFVTLAGIVLGLVRGLLHLPAAGTYPAYSEPPARQPEPAPARWAGSTAGSPRRPGPTPGAPPARRTPSALRPQPPSAAAATPPVPASPPPGVPHRGVAPTRPAAAPAPPQPTPSDPDTEPTLPGVKSVRPWWPDDLEDLFS